nr:MAG: TonB family protein [Leptolyngbya sp. IPPAS B-1204]
MGSGSGTGTGSGTGNNRGNSTETPSEGSGRRIACRNCPDVNYPEEALRARQEGTVKVLVDYDENGNVVSATLVDSSGHTVLDEAVLETVREKYRLDDSGGAGSTVLSIDMTIRGSDFNRQAEERGDRREVNVPPPAPIVEQPGEQPVEQPSAPSNTAAEPIDQPEPLVQPTGSPAPTTAPAQPEAPTPQEAAAPSEPPTETLTDPTTTDLLPPTTVPEAVPDPIEAPVEPPPEPAYVPPPEPEYIPPEPVYEAPPPEPVYEPEAAPPPEPVYEPEAAPPPEAPASEPL